MLLVVRYTIARVVEFIQEEAEYGEETAAQAQAKEDCVQEGREEEEER